MSEQSRLSLETLGDGGAIELFDVALQEVLANIQDLNTPADAERSITLTVKIKPDKSRDLGRLKYKVVPKLAPIAEQEGRVFLPQQPDASGSYYATEHNPKQPNLAFHETEVGNAR